MVNQLAYTSNVTFFNGSAHLGFAGLLPLLRLNTSVSPGSAVQLNSHDGFGDIQFGPFLQFDPVIRNGRPVYSQRLEFDVNIPTSRYNSHTTLNPGSNFWQINPYWSATLLPTPRTEVSWRLSYIYNFKNTDTGLPGVSSEKAGQAAWINFAASYARGGAVGSDSQFEFISGSAGVIKLPI